MDDKEAGLKFNLLTKGSMNHLTHQLKTTHKIAQTNLLNNAKLFNSSMKLPDYVFQFLDFLSTQPVKRILLPDTLGVIFPQTFAFISEITSKYPNIHFDFHAHNDYDLSIANVISYKSRYKRLTLQ
jgi:D-citramalate synthase